MEEDHMIENGSHSGSELIPAEVEQEAGDSKPVAFRDRMRGTPTHYLPLTIPGSLSLHYRELSRQAVGNTSINARLAGNGEGEPTLRDVRIDPMHLTLDDPNGMAEFVSRAQHRDRACEVHISTLRWSKKGIKLVVVGSSLRRPHSQQQDIELDFIPDGGVPRGYQLHDFKPITEWLLDILERAPDLDFTHGYTQARFIQYMINYRIQSTQDSEILQPMFGSIATRRKRTNIRVYGLELEPLGRGDEHYKVNVYQLTLDFAWKTIMQTTINDSRNPGRAQPVVSPQSTNTALKQEGDQPMDTAEEVFEEEQAGKLAYILLRACSSFIGPKPALVALARSLKGRYQRLDTRPWGLYEGSPLWRFQVMPKGQLESILYPT
ncbi:MAG: hypothetical protein LQ337_007115, partial [Flavoplaca oasis]